MQFYDWKSGLILLALSGSLVLFTRFVFFVLHKRIFSIVEEYSFEVFFIIERMMFDISITIIELSVSLSSWPVLFLPIPFDIVC